MDCSLNVAMHSATWAPIALVGQLDGGSAQFKCTSPTATAAAMAA